MTVTTPTTRAGLRADYRHFLTIPTRWMDNDSYGHVNNVTYFSYFDTAVNEHLINVGGLDVAGGTTIGVVVETKCIFRRSLTFPETIDAGLRVVKLGTSSVKYEIGLFRRGDDEPAATGHFVHVWVDRASQRPTPIPPRIRAALEPLVAEGIAAAVPARPAAAFACAPMTAATRVDAETLLGSFLRDDLHYLASSAVYGDGGTEALRRALALFLARPEIGLVWLAFAHESGAPIAVGACVVCHAISTSRGTLVAKLDDVTIRDGWQGRGVGSAMLAALTDHLRARGSTRIDSACHRDNTGAWRFYERLGFKPLDEERIALLLV